MENSNKNKNKSVLIRLTENQKDSLEKKADDNEMKVSEYIRYILKKEGVI